MVDLSIAVVIGVATYYFFDTTPVLAVICSLLGLAIYMLVDIRAQM